MNLSLAQLRDRYQEAIEDREEAQALWRKLKDYRGESGIFLAYKAATRVLVAQHILLPLTKLAMLKEAMALFRQAVRLDPDNPEIRFLRYSIQYNLPAFLMESGDMSEDKRVILANLPRYAEFELLPEHVSTFADFFVECKRFSSEEIAQVQAILA